MAILLGYQLSKQKSYWTTFIDQSCVGRNEIQKNEQAQAIEFFRNLLNCDVPKICIENPVGIISSIIRKPDQIIQPWQFGHGETKATCFWLKNLPPLYPTNIVEGREHRIHNMSKSKDRSKNRSLTFSGIANAMADQWG